MIKPALLRRLLHIHWILLRHGIDEFLAVSPLFRHLGILRGLGMVSPRSGKDAPRGQRIREALEDLGPIYVKFGQTLSTRRDLLPEDIADELARLQDRVPPFSAIEARRIIEAEVGQPITAAFRVFDDVPLASASIAQVHTAELPDGEAVVVKVLRPDVESRIQEDLDLMREFARLATRLWPDARRLRPVDVVTEFEKILLDELDLVREGANASELRRHFDGSPLLYIPRIHWPLTRRRVLVMERIHGTPIGDVARLKREGADLKLLADRGVEIFFTQVFRDNFFHADMHPGNIFVGPDNQYIAVDFGIVASITASDQRYLAENFLAFFKRDYRRVAEMHVESGWVPADTRIEEFESAIRAVCEPIFEKPLGEISYGHLLLRLFQTARRFNMEVQPQLVLLQKTLLNIEGLGRELYPELDLWQTAKPFLENWFKQRVGPKALLRKVRNRAPEWAAQTPDLPGLVYRALRETAEGQQAAKRSVRELEALLEETRRSRRRQVAAQTGSALLMTAALLWGMGKGIPILLGAAGVLGGLLLVRAWL